MEMNTNLCDWLMDTADAPIRYRTARELLGDTKTAKTLESELLGHPAAVVWLANLKPALPQQHRWLEHGSFDYCFENALLKAVQLGLHGGMPEVRDAVAHYLQKTQRYMELPQKRREFLAVLTANLLSLSGVEDDALQRYMLASLGEMRRFAQAKAYDIYLGEEERKGLTGVPTCWKDMHHFIRQDVFEDYGFAYPLIYDIAGLHTLYSLGDPETNRAIGDVLHYILTDAFHETVADGYGILVEGNGVYHSMGWDPKFPGWFGVRETLEGRHASKLLFYAQFACRYPAVRETRWFGDLLHCLETMRNTEGRFVFPAAWFAENRGYAVMGSHLSFGENRRKKNWRRSNRRLYAVAQAPYGRLSVASS